MHPRRMNTPLMVNIPTTTNRMGLQPKDHPPRPMLTRMPLMTRTRLERMKITRATVTTAAMPATITVLITKRWSQTSADASGCPLC